MKKIVLIAVMGMTVSVFAWCRPCGPCWRPCPPPPPCYGGYWGRGGCNFWPGFIGGVVGSIACNAVARPYYSSPVVVSQPVVTQPIVVQQPVVVTQPTVVSQPVVTTPVTQVRNVWIEGRYVDQVQANGTVLRIWQPGHYEQRTVVVP